jgi:hypothetical protein
MGRSFDRGGQSRKERERGKRRSYRQAERDREARDAVTQAKRTAAAAALTRRTPSRVTAISSAPGMMAPMGAQDASIRKPTIIIEQKRPGFLAQVFGRFFKKSA